jgi:hypothetical protein
VCVSTPKEANLALREGAGLEVGEGGDAGLRAVREDDSVARLGEALLLGLEGVEGINEEARRAGSAGGAGRFEERQQTSRHAYAKRTSTSFVPSAGLGSA